MKIYLLVAGLSATTICYAEPVSTIKSLPVSPMVKDSVAPVIPSTPMMFAEILNVLGLQQNFELKEAKVANIEASISRRKRYILYNPGYINWINKTTGDKWAAMALLAHEIGHHLNGHTIRKSGSRPNLELEADEFTGFIMHKLGASLEQSQRVMLYIANITGSKTHPGRDLRKAAIQKGWDRAAAHTNDFASMQ